MIESCWAYLKRITTKNGPLTSRKAAEYAWIKAWEDLEQWRIQRWIERIPYHIEQVLKLEGGNEYKEGHPTTTKDKAYWSALRRERQLRIRQNRETHRDAWSQFQCSTTGLPATYITHYRSLLGISESADVEDLEDDGWNNIPANDQVVHVDPPPASIDSGNPSRNRERARGGARGGGARRGARRGVQGDQAQRAENSGARKRGRPPRPPTFNVRFLQPLVASDMEEGTRSAYSVPR